MSKYVIVYNRRRDNELLFVEKILSKHGYTVLSPRNDSEAYRLALLSKAPFVTDPWVSGLDKSAESFIREIASTGTHIIIPIDYCSTHSDFNISDLTNVECGDYSLREILNKVDRLTTMGIATGKSRG